MLVLLGLFLVCFLSATILPFYSEIMFVALVLDNHDPLVLWVVASTGNTLGSIANWALARYLLRFEDHKWFPFGGERLARAQNWFQRFGVWSLMLAWAPIGGDALTFVAGLMRTRLWLFVLLVGTGKAARYAAVLYAVESLR
jgi:membrane protein YqaA with SNARE-associated domain